MKMDKEAVSGLSEVQADALLAGQVNKARAGLDELAMMSAEDKNLGLVRGAESILDNSKRILEVNSRDVEDAQNRGLMSSKVKRLTLDVSRIEGVVGGVREVISLDDPVGEVIESWDRPNGIRITRKRVPLGMIGIIYESRPNVTVDALSLCLKSGNGVILRSGRDCAATARIMFDLFQEGWSSCGYDSQIMQIARTSDRAIVGAMLRAQGLIDVIVPRGGTSLVERVLSESRVPVFAHLSGLCHIYIDSHAQLDKGLDLVVNGKMRNTAICGATETILVHSHVAEEFLPMCVERLNSEGCEVRGCSRTKRVVGSVLEASEEDWHREYLDAIVSVKIVDKLFEAIEHVNHYGSGHTDCIVTEDTDRAIEFMSRVKSAIAMHNVSTQFADGGEFGMGAEIGIATGRIHARGPVGMRQLTTMQYWAEGNGQCRA